MKPQICVVFVYVSVAHTVALFIVGEIKFLLHNFIKMNVLKYFKWNLKIILHNLENHNRNNNLLFMSILYTSLDFNITVSFTWSHWINNRSPGDIVAWCKRWVELLNGISWYKNRSHISTAKWHKWMFHMSLPIHNYLGLSDCPFPYSGSYSRRDSSE